MARYGISRAFMFCLDEPDRHPGFRAANDRTLAFAARSEGRLIPFVRLDLNESPIDEATRCLDLGARGIKLHPRAQKFTASDARLEPVFALAAERGVPILIHGGRGLPPIADGLRGLVDRNPGATLIIAHCGIADLGALANAMAGREGRVLRHLGVEPDRPARLLPPDPARAGALRERLSLRAAARVAADRAEDRAARGVHGRSAARHARGHRRTHWPTARSCRHRRSRSGSTRSRSRCSSRASTSTSRWRRRSSGRASPTPSASSASRSPPAPSGTATSRWSTGSASCSTPRRDLWLTVPELTTETEQRDATRLTFRLIHLADIEAVTAAA